MRPSASSHERAKQCACQQALRLRYHVSDIKCLYMFLCLVLLLYGRCKESLYTFQETVLPTPATRSRTSCISYQNGGTPAIPELLDHTSCETSLQKVTSLSSHFPDGYESRRHLEAASKSGRCLCYRPNGCIFLFAFAFALCSV